MEENRTKKMGKAVRRVLSIMLPVLVAGVILLVVKSVFLEREVSNVCIDNTVIQVYTEKTYSFNKYVSRISEIYYNDEYSLFEVPKKIWYEKEGKVYIMEVQSLDEYVNMLTRIKYNDDIRMVEIPKSVMYTKKQP